jgi:8-amino-7-oxononanoate synthase
MSRFDDEFLAHLAELAARDRRRGTRVPEAGLLNVSSNDYLGLSQHPRLKARAAGWGGRFGTGAGASRLVTGTLALHDQVETRLAALKGTEAALLFASGWQANASVLASLLRLPGPEPLVFFDELNHASLHYGCRAAGRAQIRFRHNDMDHLSALLEAHAGRAARRFIVTESVFSMDGDQADVAALRALADRHGAFLYLDEAHATGVLGPGGMGLASSVPGGVDLAMGTFSKALGGFGAYVAGSRALCDWLVNRASGFIHTTSLPPTVLGAADAALELVPGLAAERSRLHTHASRLRTALAQLGIDHGPSTTQIVPAIVGTEAAALALAARLRAAGILAIPIRPPTVPQGTSRLRLALSAAHTDADIDRLIAALTQAAIAPPCRQSPRAA